MTNHTTVNTRTYRSILWGWRWDASPVCFRSTSYFPLPAFHFQFRGRHMCFRCWPTRAVPAVPYLSRAWSKSVGVSRWKYPLPWFPFKGYLPLPVSTSGFVVDITSLGFRLLIHAREMSGNRRGWYYRQWYMRIYTCTPSSIVIYRHCGSTSDIFSVIHRSGRIPFPVTWCIEPLIDRLLLHFMWNWML